MLICKTNDPAHHLHVLVSFCTGVENLGIIFEFSPWVLKICPEDGLKVRWTYSGCFLYVLCCNFEDLEFGFSAFRSSLRTWRRWRLCPGIRCWTSWRRASRSWPSRTWSTSFTCGTRHSPSSTMFWSSSTWRRCKASWKCTSAHCLKVRHAAALSEHNTSTRVTEVKFSLSAAVKQKLIFWAFVILIAVPFTSTICGE